MAVSTVVSSFELLVKPLVQPSADILGAGRTIIQGYFLTISNLNTTTPVQLRLNFTAKSPDLNTQPLLAFFDILGANTPLTPTSSPTSQTYSITIGAGDTGLFLFQPDVTNPTVVSSANTELRGYVTLSLAAPFGSNSFDLLLTPQQRGTFLPKDFPNNKSDFDQLAYGLPTATGGARVTLAQIQLKPFPIAELPSEIVNLDPGLAQIIKDNPNVLLNGDSQSLSNTAITAQTNGLQPVLNLMLQRLEAIENRLGNGQPVRA